MKKILFLLLSTIAMYGQIPADATPLENIQITNNVQDNSATKVTVQTDEGVQNFLPMANLPLSTATTNALELETTVSAGAVSGFTLTNNGNGTVNIASGIAYLRAINDPYANIIKYPISAVTNLVLTDNANNYVLVDYNGGSPSITVTTNSSTINTQTNSIAYVIARVGNDLEYLNLVGQNVDPNAKLRIRFLNQEGIRRASGAILGFSNRNLTLTSSVLFSGLIRINAAAFNTASPDTFTLVYNNGSTWTRTAGQTQVNNTQYNASGVLITMPNNTFRTDYVYLLPNNPSKLYVVMGTTTYGSLTLAKGAPRPSSLPVELQVLGLEVGRLFIEKNSAAIAEVQSSFANEFVGAAVPEHNSLSGLQGGLSDQRNHLDNAQVTKLNNAANDADVLHKTGNETKTGILTLNNQLRLSNGTVFDPSLLFHEEDASDTGINHENNGEIQFLTNSSINSTVDGFGFKSVAFRKTGGLSSEFLKANGSVDSNTYELSFSKNTAFNKSFGTTAGTVAEGNDSRILNGQTAFSWGNHSGLYPTYNGTGATGTWGINVTGNAETATNASDRIFRITGNFPSLSFINTNTTVDEYFIGASINSDNSGYGQYLYFSAPTGKSFYFNKGITATTYTGGATLTDAPTAPTAAPGSTGDQIANLNFVNSAIGGGVLAFNAGNKTVWNKGNGASASTTFGQLSAGSATGSDWTSFGYASSNSKTSGNGWSSYGAYSGVNNSSGSGYALFGAYSASKLSDDSTPATSFNNSTYVGYNTKVSINGVTNENVFGYSATGNGSNTVTLGNTSVTSTYIRGVSVFTTEYTVSSLPTPTGKAFAVVTDALAPTYMASVVGGGTVVTPVFYNGTAWVCH